jgi:uncharacterized protein YcbK (DUF882 family)
MVFDQINAHKMRIKRRVALAMLGCVGATSALPSWARSQHERRIALECRETGESFDGTYWSGGAYDPAALHRIDWLMRDFHSGAVAKIDPALIDALQDLQASFGARRSLTILSGFRTAGTNAELRHEGWPAASDSQHVVARAADVRIAGVSTSQLHSAALRLGYGGIGLYRDYVHIDTGPRRSWYAPHAACHGDRACDGARHRPCGQRCDRI